MKERIGNATGFEMVHKHLVHTPEKLRGFSAVVDDYYQDRHLKGMEEGRRIGLIPAHSDAVAAAVSRPEPEMVT